MADRTIESEVVIVGAGPAGCVLGYLLARSGVDVTLVEREPDLQREFRGYFFQPLVARLFDQMGILAPLLDEVDHERCPKLFVEVFGRRYVAFDFTVLTEWPNYGLLIEQPPLLRFLIDRAADYRTFTFHDGTSAVDLVSRDDTVTGVSARHRPRNEEWTIRGRLVVGADGRYSTVRDRAGIDPGLEEVGVEILWFKLPKEAVDVETIGRFGADGLLGYIPLGDEVQVAWIIEAGAYPAIRARGIERFRDRVTAVDPALEGILEDHLTGFKQCTILDPASGMSDDWVRDGLLLIGDAAHVANPFGAQGNSLAIQDAVVAHPLIVRALRGSSGPIREADLSAFEQVRRPAVARVMAVQATQLTANELYVRYRGRVPPVLMKYMLRTVLGAMSRFPRATRRWTRLYAFGPGPIEVDTSSFTDTAPRTDG